MSLTRHVLIPVDFSGYSLEALRGVKQFGSQVEEITLVHVHDEHVWLLVDEPSAKKRDHSVVGGRYCRQLFNWGLRGDAGAAQSSTPEAATVRLGTECRWQIATASASAASCGEGN